MRSSKSTGTPAAPSAPALITLQRHLHLQLRPALQRLRAVRSAVSTCALALQQQNADADADVALLLRLSAADSLDAEIERLQGLLDAIDIPCPSDPDRVGVGAH
jgi:hypothetical protein